MADNTEQKYKIIYAVYGKGRKEVYIVKSGLMQIPWKLEIGDPFILANNFGLTKIDLKFINGTVLNTEKKDDYENVYVQSSVKINDLEKHFMEAQQILKSNSLKTCHY